MVSNRGKAASTTYIYIYRYLIAGYLSIQMKPTLIECLIKLHLPETNQQMNYEGFKGEYLYFVAELM